MGVPLVSLNNGVRMPQLGLGVFKVSDDEAERAVLEAIRAGYRSVDTARLYENERGVGRAVRGCGLPRDDLFVTTKLWNTDHAYDDALRAFDASMERLGLERLDLYLIHWPAPRADLYPQAWRALTKLYADGRIRAIGVSNFAADQITRLIDQTSVVPAVNQIELHPWLTQPELRAFHTAHGIATEAWSPLGRGGSLLELPELTDIAKAHGRTAAQIVLRWHVQLGNIVIPKSVTPSRIMENIDIFDFELAEDELTVISALDSGHRLGPDPATFG